MKVALLAEEKAGMIGLLALLTQAEVPFVITCSHDVIQLCELLKIEHMYDNWLHTPKIIGRIKKECDWLLCIHGRVIVPDTLLKALPCVNIHPGWDGANPAARWLNRKSESDCFGVKAHEMTEEIDKGDIYRNKLFALTATTVKEVYNEIYPYYVTLVIEMCKMYNGEAVSQHVWKTKD